MMRHLPLGILCVAAAMLPCSEVHGQSAPLADHHQHLFSPAIAALVSGPPPAAPFQPITANDIVPMLDAAGMKRAVVLSVAAVYVKKTRTVENEYEKVKAENDWTSQQVALYPNRLVGFCSFNPLRDYALEELDRCAKDPRLGRGLKLHFGNSVVDYHNPQHIARLRRIFRSANNHRMAIVVHMRASISQKMAYGPEEARIFLNDLLPEAPDVPVQIAHLAGAGGYADPLADQALAVFAEAIKNKDPRVKRLWFDVTTIAVPDSTTDQLKLAAIRIREVGVRRILYGSDAATAGSTPREGWAAFQRVPLSGSEFRMIAGNIPPYLKR